MFITGIILVLALLGAYTTCVLFIKRVHDCSFEDAIWFSKELIKDYMYDRPYSWIHMSDFPMMVMNDLIPFFSEETNKNWCGVLQLRSTATQTAGIMDGTPYYAFVIPWEDKNEATYISIIQNLAKICLTNMHCTITDVVIDFLDWTNSDYKICRIRYARTAPEQLSFRNIQVKSDMDSIGSTLTEVHDSELDAELDLFR